MKFWNKNVLKIALSVIVLIIVFVLGAWAEYARDMNYTYQIIRSIKPIRENNFNYHFTYPLLSYNFDQANQFLRNISLDNQLDSYVQNQTQNQNAQNLSVYVRDLSDNMWAGTNEDAQYHPGSMLKVLIMMAYFREAEFNSAILQNKFLYSQATDQEIKSLQFGAPTNLQINNYYSVTNLIENMIENSDNGAEQLLQDNVDRSILNSAYSDLNIPNPDVVTDYTMSARQYTAFLRILYNATYLTEAYSEQALSIMAQSTYRDGIVAGLPYGIPVPKNTANA